jgi:hypothetical protein
MKKSKLLQEALDHPSSVFICNSLKYIVGLSYTEEINATDMAGRDRQRTALQLIHWIQDSLVVREENKIHVQDRGVAGWLLDQGLIEYESLAEQWDNPEICEYRRLWLKDMIAYWKGQGD